MRIVCPSCSAAYDVPDAMLADRQVVRCARCTREWHPIPPREIEVAAPPPATSVAAPAVPEAPAPEDSWIAMPDIAAPPRPSLDRPTPPTERRPLGAMAIDRLMADPAPPPASLALRLAWIGSIVLVLALLGAAVTWRTQVMAAWPPSTRLYAALGLSP
jgi:predicted Zn finger-like uncharacterized protein